MDQLRQIEAFVAVVRNGSFVKAAERLDTSKAAESRLMLELEAALGTRLMNRTKRKFSLTDSGAEYFERCRRLLDDLAEANAAASATTASPAGRLVELLPQYRGPDIDIQAVYPSRRHLSGKVRAMVDFLAEAFARPGWL